MKKVLFGLLIMLSLSMSSQNSFDEAVDKTSNGAETVYTDGKEAVTTVYSDLKTIAPKISDGLKEVAKGLKVGAESVWDILIKQQLIYSIGYLMCIILGILSWIHFYYRMEDGRKNDWGPGHGEPTSYHLLAAITLFVAIFFSTISTIHFTDMLTGFINPEFGAIKTIATIVQNIK